MPAGRLIVLVCLIGAANTVSIGAFPSLLPEVSATHGLADWQLGAVAGAFGLARMVANVPAGLFMTHHLRTALVVAPLFLLGGALVMAGAAGFATLLLGRALMGIGHTLTTLGSLTAVLRYRAGPTLASSLNAMEFSAMLGVLAGATLLTVLPRTVPWPVAFLLACAPVALSLVLLPALGRALPAAGPGARPLFARADDAGGPAPDAAGGRAGLALLATLAGTVLAVSYATVEQFVIPVRGSREFGLDRAGIARLSMLTQITDLAALLPLGTLADRRGTAPVLAGVLLVFSLGLGLVGFGTLPLAVLGCALYGLSMAGWMLPVGLLRSATPPAQVAWRTALYRVAVDGGMFLGPFLAGVLATWHPGLVPGLTGLAAAAVGLTMLAVGRRPAR